MLICHGHGFPDLLLASQRCSTDLTQDPGQVGWTYGLRVSLGTDQDRMSPGGLCMAAVASTVTKKSPRREGNTTRRPGTDLRWEEGQMTQGTLQKAQGWCHV